MPQSAFTVALRSDLTAIIAAWRRCAKRWDVPGGARAWRSTHPRF
jgi:hypothetical protein